MNLRNILSGIALLAGILSAHAIEYTHCQCIGFHRIEGPRKRSGTLSVGVPQARKERFDYQLTATESLPVLIYQKVEGGETNKRITLFITATERYLLQLRRTGEKRSMP